MTFVVDRYIVASHRGPESLEMAVEEEGVQVAGWGYFLAE